MPEEPDDDLWAELDEPRLELDEPRLDLDAEQVIDLRFELFHVRRQLDRLVTSRLIEPLDPVDEHAYRELADREAELLIELIDELDR